MVAVLNGIYYANPPARAIEWTKYQQIAASMPLHLPFLRSRAIHRGFPVLATRPSSSPTSSPTRRAVEVRRGRAFTFSSRSRAVAARETGLRVGSEIFLTHGIAQSRQLGQADAVAPHVHKEFAYAVVGVLEPTGSAHDRALFTDLTSTWIIHAHDRRKLTDPSIRTTTEDDLLETDRLITGIYLRVASRPGREVTALLPAAFDALRRDPTITVAQPVQQIDALFRIVSNIDVIILAMAGVVMVSSAISIMLALYNSMEQRRRQVAVLRVLGCSRPRIFGLLVTEATIIGVLGAAIGLALAVAGALLAAGVLKNAIGLVVTPVFAPDITLAVLTGAILLSALAGIVPAVMAYRSSVAEHLKPLG